MKLLKQITTDDIRVRTIDGSLVLMVNTINLLVVAVNELMLRTGNLDQSEFNRKNK